MFRNFTALSFALSLFAGSALAQSSTTTTTTTTSNAAQIAAIQQAITTGIENGTLSQTQIQQLQAQELQLQAGSLAGNNTRQSNSASVTPDTVSNAAQRFANEVKATNGATRTAPRITGPDPFTYNTLGPDAYQSQKYKNPAYNVPAYPTTTPVPDGLSQQYSGASAGAPYGAGYGQQPIPTGIGQGVYAPSVGTGGNAAQQGVYVYTPHSTR